MVMCILPTQVLLSSKPLCDQFPRWHKGRESDMGSRSQVLRMVDTDQNSALSLPVNIHSKKKVKKLFPMLFVILYVSEKGEASNMT